MANSTADLDEDGVKMNATMNKGKNKGKDATSGKPEQRSEHYSIFVRIKPEIGRALDLYLAASDPEVTTKAAIEAALKRLLSESGFWPIPEPE